MAGEKILVVEDEGLTAMELQRKLKFWGYDVPTFAFSRREAVKKAEEIKPDLILMDIVLKGEGDGIDAVKEIRDNIDVPVIYLTAYSDESTLERAEVTEPYGFIIKPFEEKELHESIGKALYKHGIILKLKENGEWLDKKLENSRGAVVVTDAEGNITFMNKYAKFFTGFKLDKVSFKDFMEVLNLDITEGPEKPVQELIKKSGMSSNSTLNGPDGSEIPIEYSISPIKDDSGEFVGATLVFQDITEKVEAEKSLQESEKWFKSIYHQSTTGMEIYDTDGVPVDANPAALDLFGTSDLSNLSEFNLFKDFKIPSDKKEKLLNDDPIVYEIKFDFKDYKDYKSFKTTKSDFICLEISIKPLEIDDTSSKMYLVQFKDLTAYKTTENSLKKINNDYGQILRGIGPIFFALDNDLNCTHWNDASQDFTGISYQNAVGKPISSLLKDIDGDDVQNLYQKTLETKKKGFMIKKFIIDDEYLRFFEINTYPYLNGISVLIRDVTDAKLREEELEHNEALYRSILIDQTEPICRLDTNGKLTFSNEVYRTYFGDETQGSFVFSLKEEDKERMKDYMNSFDAENQVKLFESPIIMPDGNVQWWQWVTKAVFNVNGKIEEFQFVGHDMTRQKKIEEEMNQVLCNLEVEIKDKTDEFQATKESLNSQIKDLNDEIVKTKDHERSLEKRRDELEGSVKNISKDLLNIKNTLEKQLEENKKAQDSFEKEKSALEKEIHTKTLDFEKVKESLEKELDEKNTELNQLNEAIKSETDQNKELRLSLEKTRKDSQEQLESERSEFEKRIEKLGTELERQINIEKETRASLHEKEALLKDVHNRVKKNMQMISSLTGLQSEYIRDQIVEKFRDSQNHIKSIALVHEKLYESPNMGEVNFSEYVNSLVEDISRSHGVDQERIKIKVIADDLFLDIDSAVSSGLIVNEIVSNSFKHAFPGDMQGEILIEVDALDKSEHQGFSMKISDNGVGLPENLDVEKADTLGLQLVRTLVGQMDGELKVNNSNGDNGTEFIVELNS
ncbi:PAS domain S-box protein [Methanobacterium aggregans]|uniref:PAS domain S-box protein n=1 Tax=Methanobacterium aggregans TaxID=1615586 RepID=UPI0032109A0C